MSMKPGMMMLMSEIDRRQRGNTSEYSSNGRRMIGYDRPENTYRDRDNDGRYNEDRRYAYGGYDDHRMAYGGMDYPESRRRRDSRGRFMESDHMPHMGGYRSEYDEGRYGMGNRYEPESRRRRDSRGRYAMGRDPRMMDDDYDDDDDDMRGQTWYPPEMHGGSRYGIRNVYADIHTGGVANRPSGGMTNGDMSRPVDEHTARMWVERMDGGEHFKPEQADPLRSTICPECGKWEWYVAMNAMYSDHCETAKKLGMDKPEFYAHMAKDFLMDTDAKPHKLRRYMETIPR